MPDGLPEHHERTSKDREINAALLEHPGVVPVHDRGVLPDGRAWYVALVVLTLPLTPVALWVGFYAAVAVGAVVGTGPEAHSWLVSLVWVLVWSLTAWLNARMLEKVLLRGWAGRWVERTD